MSEQTPFEKFVQEQVNSNVVSMDELRGMANTFLRKVWDQNVNNFCPTRNALAEHPNKHVQSRNARVLDRMVRDGVLASYGTDRRLLVSRKGYMILKKADPSLRDYAEVEES
jgi:hypothetical protein